MFFTNRMIKSLYIEDYSAEVTAWAVYEIFFKATGFISLWTFLLQTELANFQLLSENVEKKMSENAQKEQDYEDAPDEFKGR